MKLLLYCTKSKPYLFESISEKGKYMLENNEWFKELNGKIVAECEFEVEEMEKSFDNTLFTTKTLGGFALQCRSCLNAKQLYEYQPNYAIHIKNLHIFDKPRELNEYDRINKENCFEVLNNAPQNMMKICERMNAKEQYILISIRPEYLVKILNKEKTIEIRKQILNCMKGKNKNV